MAPHVEGAPEEVVLVAALRRVDVLRWFAFGRFSLERFSLGWFGALGWFRAFGWFSLGWFRAFERFAFWWFRAFERWRARRVRARR